MTERNEEQERKEDKAVETEQTTILTDIRDEVHDTNTIANKFGSVFASIHKSIDASAMMLGKMVDITVESFEAQQRAAALASVSSAPDVHPQVAPVVVNRASTGSSNASGDGDGLMNNLLGSLFGNLFGNGAFGAVAGFAGKFIRGAAFLTIVAPWLQGFMTDMMQNVLDLTPLSEDAKNVAAQITGDAAFRSAVGFGLMGWKGAIIGGVSTIFSLVGDKIAEAMGLSAEDMNKTIATIGGIEIDGNVIKEGLSVAGAALVTVPGALSALGTAAVRIVSLINPWVAAATAVALALNWGKNQLQKSRADLEDMTIDTDTSASEGSSWKSRGLAFAGLLDKENLSVADSATVLANALEEMMKDGTLDDTEKATLHDQMMNKLAPALAVSGNIDIQNPVLNNENMEPRTAKLIAEVLGAIGETDAQRKWDGQRLEKLMKGNSSALWGGTDRAREVTVQIQGLEERLRENPGDLEAMQLLPTLQSELDAMRGQAQHEGYNLDEIIQRPDLSSIQPAATERAARVSHVEQTGRDKEVQSGSALIINAPQTNVDARKTSVSHGGNVVNKNTSTVVGAGAAQLPGGIYSF